MKGIAKRETGLPIAYITGHKEFYGFDFIVSPDVLIPKPDTEILVERAVQVILDKIKKGTDNTRLSVCDMCTGSGCIGISVAKILKEVHRIPEEAMPLFTLVDISTEALTIAEKNIIRLIDYSGITLVHSNLFQEVPLNFDVILSNPPYIPHSMVDKLLQDGRSEPRLALDGDVSIDGSKAFNPQTNELLDDGLEIIRNLIPQAKNHLKIDGIILMETGEYNAKEAASLGETASFKSIIHKDLEGDLRMVELF